MFFVNSLGVLPLELNKLLIIVVVLSMALTPFLNEAGRRAASFIEENYDAENVCHFVSKSYNFGSFVHTHDMHTRIVGMSVAMADYWCII